MIDTLIHSASSHLVQSTLFAGAAALLTLAFRANRAQVRFWLWLSASLKFLIRLRCYRWSGVISAHGRRRHLSRGSEPQFLLFSPRKAPSFRATHWEESVPPRTRPRLIEPRSIR
jgi:hypothetical protein